MAKTAHARKTAAPATSDWQRLEARYGTGVGHRGSVGLLALATDRIGAFDFAEFLQGIDGLAVFTTRVPMAPVATPETLAAMGPHLVGATELLVPGSRLDSVAFSCTSGTVAIGVDKVAEAVRMARPGVPVTTPIQAGAEGLRRLGCRRISLLCPYRLETAELISGFFRSSGFELLTQASFVLDGDPDMNRISDDSLIEAGRQVMHADAEALFISCTGMRTANMVERLEQALGKPVVTSNQALAWHALRLAGITDRRDGLGSLFRRF